MTKGYLEIMGDAMEDFLKWQDFENDMAADPYGDENWASRADEFLA